MQRKDAVSSGGKRTSERNASGKYRLLIRPHACVQPYGISVACAAKTCAHRIMHLLHMRAEIAYRAVPWTSCCPLLEPGQRNWLPQLVTQQSLVVLELV